ncbi:late competence development ComFB family protein [Paraneptunicella aestuarii]|uniref:late competence development ComFB family protein n=1 Tax=Paraneptunicella aestuarii TaxID=2831148 RepID=UPI001E48C501|nr:late competence development ComFB family protein [Paraneptunicella aestuarii]UAA37781.1 late competence development ComFB family protein [Paraneptunicella aestuarii]
MKLDDDVHNYYEHLVLERIGQLGLQETKDADYLADLCCMALNQVPPKYIRYEVDMAFFLSSEERMKMEKEVADAIDNSVKVLDERK